MTIVVRENRARTHIIAEPILPHDLYVNKESVPIRVHTSSSIHALTNDVAYTLFELTDGGIGGDLQDRQIVPQSNVPY